MRFHPMLLIAAFSIGLWGQPEDLSWLEWGEGECKKILRQSSVKQIRTGSVPSGRIDLDIQLIQQDSLRALFRLQQLSRKESDQYALDYYKGFQQRLEQLEMADLLVFRISAYRTFQDSIYQDSHKLPLSPDKRPPLTVQFKKSKTLLKITGANIIEASQIVSLSARDHLIGFPLDRELMQSKKKVWVEIWAVDQHFGETHHYRAQFKTARLLK